MDFTVDYIYQNQDQELRNCTTQSDVFERQNEIGGINNQNRIIWEFKSCKKFLEYNRVSEFHSRLPINRPEGEMWKKKNQLWMIPQEGIHQLEKQLRKINRDNLEFSDVEPYIKYLSWHLSVDIAANRSKVTKPTEINFPTRWGDNRFLGNADVDKERINSYIKNVKEIYKAIENPKTDWVNTTFLYHECISLAWSLIQVGLGEMALWIINPYFTLLENEIEVEGRNRSLLSLTCSAMFQDYRLRILGTLTWVKAFAYKQIKNNTEYHKALDKYVDYFYQNSLGHYNVNNRVFEASILVYKHKPTKINKSRVFDLFQNTISLFMDEPTECMRERGLACFDFIKTIFKEDYEKYNS